MRGPGRPYYGYGAPPPPPYGFPYPPPGPGQPPPYPPHHPYPVYPGVFYPIDPAYFYPPGGVQVVDNAEPAEIVPELPGETVELPWSTYKWVPACLSQNSIPPGALLVGRDVDDAEIYAGRARHEGDILPAKVIPSKNACYISYGGEEILKDQFEVLVPAMFSWQFSSDGQVPPGAVEAGVTADGEKLYFGRVTHDGVTTPGKVQPSHGTCYYPFDGEEKNSNEMDSEQPSTSRSLRTRDKNLSDSEIAANLEQWILNEEDDPFSDNSDIDENFVAETLDSDTNSECSFSDIEPEIVQQ